MKKLFFLLAFSAVVLMPMSVSAAGDYSCWCGDDIDGAVKTPMSIPADTNPAALKTDCIEFCRASNKEFLVYTDNANLEPGASLKCWRQDECQARSPEGALLGIWEPEQPPDCKKGYHHCYNPSTPVPLTVAIGEGGSVTSVNSLGEYINAFYDWAFYAALIIAVVMVMIGGLQYMVGKGVGDVQKAKSRITNAIIGVIILMSAYTILATVNPALINLEIPNIPKVKTVIFIDDDSWCEALYDNGFTINYNGQVWTNTVGLGEPSGACGAEAEVISGKDGAETTIDSCYFSDCTNGTCLQPTDQNKPPYCLACKDIGPGGDEDAPLATPQVCDAIGYSKTGSVATLCFHSYDLGLGPTRPKIVTEGTCAEVEILCDYGKVKSCRDLDKMVVYAATDQENIECTNGPDALSVSLEGDPSIAKDICENYDKYCPGMKVSPINETCTFIATQGADDLLGTPSDALTWYATGVGVAFFTGPAAVIALPWYYHETSTKVWQWDCVNSKYLGGDGSGLCVDKDYNPIKGSGTCDDAGIGECAAGITR